MELYFAPRGILQIDNARLVFKNFRGEGGKFNKEGDRNFALLITGGSVDGREVSAEEMANALMNDLNRFGVGWNVKIKAPREEGDAPFIYLPVKVAFNDRGPQVYVESGASHRKLYEDTVSMLDDIDIASVSLDIRPYDSEVNGQYYRTAYLQSMKVVQNIDRFAAEYAEGVSGRVTVLIARQKGLGQKRLRLFILYFRRNISMNFGQALEKVKAGEKIFRLGWNGKDMFVVYQKGYPDGIPCNQQTAKAWGLKEGDLFKCDPYLQIKTANGSHAMWVPSIGDILSEDWEYIR